ncbi:Hsp70 family protein [Rhodomicrobium vannielii]|nr:MULTISPECIES: Hsp70 family protein [Rhodomicrobium]
MPRDRNWIGCIDFGTALSKAALVKRKVTSQLREREIIPLPLRDGLSGNPVLLPSVIYLTDDAVLFGDEAAREAVRGEYRGRLAFSSPKQYLSTQDTDSLDEALEAEVDPTGSYTPRQLLVLFLAHLLSKAQTAAERAPAPWPVPLRLARPAWDRARARDGEKTLKGLLLCAFAVVDRLGDRLAAPKGLPHDLAHRVLAEIIELGLFAKLEQFDHVFESAPGTESASILEANAVAAGLIRRTGRRVIVVADIGAGTSDFGAFMTGLAGNNVVGEIPQSSQILRQAGDHLDMLLTRRILDEVGIDPHDQAGKGAARRLRSRQRANKEALFTDGSVTVDLNDGTCTVTREEFLADKRVQEFTQNLRSKFHATLKVAIACARHFSPRNVQTPIEIVLTGGGNRLPMVTELSANPPLSWRYVEANRELTELLVNAPGMRAVERQLAVAVGGAVQYIPQQTAPVHI